MVFFESHKLQQFSFVCFAVMRVHRTRTVAIASRMSAITTTTPSVAAFLGQIDELVRRATCGIENNEEVEERTRALLYGVCDGGDALALAQTLCCGDDSDSVTSAVADKRASASSAYKCNTPSNEAVAAFAAAGNDAPLLSLEARLSSEAERDSARQALLQRALEASAAYRAYREELREEESSATHRFFF